MIYGVMARIHVLLARTWRGQSGQGTVEYVALILLVAALLAGIVAATKGTKVGNGGIADAIVKQMRKALDAVG